MQDKELAKKIKALREQGYSTVQSQEIAKSHFYQQGGKTNGYDNIQKTVKRVLRNVQTNEIKEGKLTPGTYTKVEYDDGTVDYLTKDGERQFFQMPNYMQYMEKQRKSQQSSPAGKELAQNTNTPYFQQGGWGNPMFQMPNIQSQQYAPQQNFSIPPPSQSTMFAPGSYNSWDTDNNGIPDSIQGQGIPASPQEQQQYQFSTANSQNTPLNLVDSTRQSPLQQPQYNTRYNLFNGSGGIDLATALNYTGQQFGQGNVGMGVAGAGLSFLKGARELLGGYASGRENNRVRNEYFDNIYNQEPMYTYAQQGGKISNADALTGQYLVDEGAGNTNLENNEFVRRADTGQVQRVVGEPHIKNNKEAEGVNATLNNGDKVLSDYTKIPAKDIKELKDRYNISLKKGATFADAQKAYDKKLGIQKTTDELASFIEKLGDNESTKDETAKRLNEMALAKEIEQQQTKLETLKDPQAVIFEDLFAMQEALPKVSGGNVLLDKNGKPIEGSEEDVKQQGGIFELAKKHGLSMERAQELINMQQGGESQQVDPMQQLFQAVASMLQQGATVEQISEQLLAQGVPEQEVGNIIQQVVQQLQAQPQEQQMAQQGGQSFQTGISPILQGYDVTSQNVVGTDTLTGVEDTQVYTGQGYGKQMADVDKLIDIHSWYFDTDAKKKAFREASKKKGAQPEVKAFQEAYNNEIVKRAKSAGVSEEEAEKLKNTVGFSNEGARKLDGLYGAFTSTRPLFEIAKKPDGAPEVIKTASPIVEETEQQVIEERTQNVLPWLPQAYRLPPSALDPINKQEINLGRMDAVKLTPEPMLAEIERSRLAEASRMQASGLTPQQQNALLASGLGASQSASNDAIYRTETANLQSQASADQFNLNQQSKQDLTNLQLESQYQTQAYGALNANESAWRNYYSQLSLDQANKFKYINDTNLINAENSQYQVIPGQGVKFLNNQSTNYSDPQLEKAIGDLTIDQRNKFVNEVIGGQSRYNALMKARSGA